MSTVLIMAGGTGGHIMPALAVAEVLRERGVAVRWMGTPAGLEARLVPVAGYEIEWITVAGLRGKGALALVAAPLRLARALWQALGAFRRVRPAAVLGMGGFASGPGGLAAWLTRTPFAVHEQNAVPGLTNRVLARLADRVFEAFPGSFERSGVECVGNPVRAAIERLPSPEARYAARQGPLRVLVLGGSQGALALNTAVPDALARLPEALRPEAWHQAGAKLLAAAEAAYAEARVAARVVPFIEDMAEAYAWADLVICRAGAMTVAELAAAGVAAVLVPLPSAVDDHQTANARYLADAGAAVLLPQYELTPDRLAAELERLLADRAALARMATLARGRAIPDAALRVADALVELAREGEAS
jgi:UDP-N-acetylglucosamine--N-acetylmuramyl-(pentapeptide) pyrophosphoryl-undecaprenol N-acetylglucosamine transferase